MSALLLASCVLPSAEKATVKVEESWTLADFRDALWRKKENAFLGDRNNSTFKPLQGELLFRDTVELGRIAMLCPVFEERPSKACVVELELVPNADLFDQQKRQLKKPNKKAVLMEGYMRKQGGESKGNMQLWKQRYFVLQSQTLFWFENQESRNNSDRAINCIPMGSVHPLLPGEDGAPDVKADLSTFYSRKDNVFTLMCEHVYKRNISLAADSKDVLKQWVQAIQDSTMRRVKSVMVAVGETLLRRGLQTKGLFRVAAKKSEQDRCRGRFDLGQFTYLDDDIDSVEVIAGVFKHVLNDMPNPLFPYDVYKPLVKLGSSKPEKELVKIADVMVTLPYTNLCLIRYLLRFLKTVSGHCDVNMMNSRNLAIVFSPNILRPRPENMELSLAENDCVLRLVEACIDNHEVIFEMIDSAGGAVSKLRERNQSLVHHASTSVPGHKSNNSLSNSLSGNSTQLFMTALAGGTNTSPGAMSPMAAGGGGGGGFGSSKQSNASQSGGSSKAKRLSIRSAGTAVVGLQRNGALRAAPGQQSPFVSSQPSPRRAKLPIPTRSARSSPRPSHSAGAPNPSPSPSKHRPSTPVGPYGSSAALHNGGGGGGGGVGGAGLPLPHHLLSKGKSPPSVILRPSTSTLATGCVGTNESELAASYMASSASFDDELHSLSSSIDGCFVQLQAHGMSSSSNPNVSIRQLQKQIDSVTQSKNVLLEHMRALNATVSKLTSSSSHSSSSDSSTGSAEAAATTTALSSPSHARKISPASTGSDSKRMIPPAPPRKAMSLANLHTNNSNSHHSSSSGGGGSGNNTLLAKQLSPTNAAAASSARSMFKNRGGDSTIKVETAIQARQNMNAAAPPRRMLSGSLARSQPSLLQTERVAPAPSAPLRHTQSPNHSPTSSTVSGLASNFGVALSPTNGPLSSPRGAPPGIPGRPRTGLHDKPSPSLNLSAASASPRNVASRGGGGSPAWLVARNSKKDDNSPGGGDDLSSPPSFSPPSIVRVGSHKSPLKTDGGGVSHRATTGGGGGAPAGSSRRLAPAAADRTLRSGTVGALKNNPLFSQSVGGTIGGLPGPPPRAHSKLGNSNGLPPSSGISRSASPPPPSSPSLSSQSTSSSAASSPVGSPRNGASASPVFAQALYDYDAPDKSIQFKKNDRIEVIEQPDDKSGWWLGKTRSTTKNQMGWFPLSYVKIVS